MVHSSMRTWFAVCLVSSLAAAPVTAQGALVLLGYGGFNAPTVSLADSGVGFGVAPAGGGGIALQVSRRTAVRATATFAKSDIDNWTLAEPGVRRSLIGVDLQLGIPNTSSIVPYFIVGLARASFDPDEPGVETFEKLATKLGTGINYIPDNSIVAFFAELSGWFYRFDRLGLDRHQFDVMLAAGLAYAIPF